MKIGISQSRNHFFYTLLILTVIALITFMVLVYKQNEYLNIQRDRARAEVITAYLKGEKLIHSKSGREAFKHLIFRLLQER